MITLNPNPTVDELTVGLNHLSRRIQTAIKRAVRKLILWLRRQMLQQASRMTGVPQKEIVRYRRIHLDIEGMEGTVWLGTSPLPLHLAGRVSWNPASAGATVAGRQYAGVLDFIGNTRTCLLERLNTDPPRWGSGNNYPPGMFTAAAPRSGYVRVETSRRDTPPTTGSAVTGPFPMRSAMAGSRWSFWVPRWTNSKTKSPEGSSEGPRSAFGKYWSRNSITR
uniref:Uncharacterized protein n=1 Tax=Candidatus Kentrum sp. FM TaxID=2126340 RepID=A0A450SLM1_9GAMM|nr:MAG: hypothetical protein BECKFM1743A_GA0114220_101147 [Candidatus Kentron sp. FM]VFJ54597.1 MAG: hypothetical protein BECKFM1743C_GA0114222_101417 [Candidatus Kentron sp. FM]VFK10375.1 MAG: hypothetical protein BECKFM1743B_GA0114221_101387 [Candidatus Kentron sp. FM]